MVVRYSDQKQQSNIVVRHSRQT